MPQINPPQVTGGGIVFSTPGALISKALEDIGVTGFAMPATAAEIASGLLTLNAMLDTWGVLRENISIRTAENFALNTAQWQYAIGINASDFNTVRPIKIEQAYIRDPNTLTDYHIDVDMSEGEYSDIPLKGQSGIPTALWYDPGYPFGMITFDFMPQLAYQLYINSWKPLAKITDPSDQTQLVYPDGYESAMLFNLEVLLCPPNKKPCPPEIKEMAIRSYQAIQAAYGEVPEITNWDLPGVAERKRTSGFFDMGMNE